MTSSTRRDASSTRRLAALALVTAALAACAVTPEAEEKRPTRQRITGRWQPVSTGGDNGRGTPDDLGGEGCSGGLRPGARALGERLRSQFSIASYGGYNCRSNTANPSELSIHAVGRALDLTARGSAGDEIANHLVAHAASLGVQRIIWNRTIWQIAASGPTSRQYSGPNPHTDHVHVEVTRSAAENTGPNAGVDDPNGGFTGDDDHPTGKPDATGDREGTTSDDWGDNGKTDWGGDEYECKTSTDCDADGAMACKQGFCVVVCTEKLWQLGVCD